MSEKPILFTAEMILAKREGRKTVTCRVITNIPAYYTIGNKPQSYGPDDYAFFDRADPVGTYPTLASPRYNVGDLLWVKEAWAYYPDENHVIYRAREGVDLQSQGVNLKGCWKSSRFMLKKYARTWLEVVSVRAERSDEGLWVWRYEFKEYLRQGSEDNGRIHETT